MKTRRVYLISITLLILLVGLLGLVGQHLGQAHAATVCSSNGSLQGVDVSHNSGSIDWTQVAQAGISFGYAQANDGTKNDPAFQTNYAGMKSAGMKRGASLFFEPSSDPTAQANAFLSSLTQAGFTFGDLLPAIDVEVTSGQSPAMLVSKLQMAANTIQSALGVMPVIYTSAPFWDGSAADSTAFAKNPLWVANWGVTCPNIPSAWNTWSLWQFADNGNVPGIAFSVDLDKSNGTTLPTYADTTPPVLTLPSTITTDATSPQGAVVTYTVTATDPDNPASQLTITCTPTSGSTFAIGTTTVNCTASDPANNSTSGSFQVVVNGAATQVSNLITTVNSFHLAGGIQNSFDSQLQAVQADLTANNTANACSDLTGFINHVKAQSGKHLTVSQANQLIAAATQIQTVLGC